MWIFNDNGITGRAAYFTLALPAFMAVILLGRRCSLENVGRKIEIYYASWDTGYRGQGQYQSAATSPCLASYYCGLHNLAHGLHAAWVISTKRS